METLKYRLIKSDKQYNEYCQILHDLDFTYKKKNKEIKDEMELLTLLIEKYDEEHEEYKELDPVEILKSLMRDHKLKSIELAEILSVSTGLVSDILNYKKGFSKVVIRKLSSHFKLSQEAFNRAYELKVSAPVLKPKKSARKSSSFSRKKTLHQD